MPSQLVPPGWPSDVPAPQLPGWERAAVAWLLDLCPPEYRAHAVLRQHPVVLARFAAQHVAANVQVAREGLRTVRADLAGLIPPEAVEAVITAYDREGRRLAQAGRQVELVAAALTGRRWVPRL